MLFLSHFLVHECVEHYLMPRASRQLLSIIKSMERIFDGKQSILVQNTKIDNRTINFRVESLVVKRCVDRQLLVDVMCWFS